MKRNRLGFTPIEQEKVNKIVRDFKLVNYTNNLDKCIIFGNETKEHYLAKAAICHLLHRNGFRFLTEFNIPGKYGLKNKPDILILSPLIGVEILYSESLDKYKEKKNKAVDGLKLVPINYKDAMVIENLEWL